MRRALACSAALILTAATFLGCGDSGPDLGQVRGKVTLDGKPLDKTLVTFVPAEGGTASTGITDEQGNYQLGYVGQLGALLGKHKVSLTTVQDPVAAPAAMSSSDPAYEKQAASANYNVKRPVERIPERYNSKTTLEKEVTAGENEINLELTSGP